MLAASSTTPRRHGNGSSHDWSAGRDPAHTLERSRRSPRARRRRPAHGRPGRRELQRATAPRLKARGLADDIPVAMHGKFTSATALAVIEAQYFLGAASDTYLRKDADGHRVLTEGAQRIIREPESRTPSSSSAPRTVTRRSSAARATTTSSPASSARRRQGRQGRAEVRGRAGRHQGAPAGLELRPARSTTGPRGRATTTRCRGAAASSTPASWPAGCRRARAGSATRRRSSPAPRRARAAGRCTGRASPGDLALFDTARAVTRRCTSRSSASACRDTRYSTFGGNTSAGNGSQSDGGMVARRDDRSTVGAFRIIGFARPPWGK